MGQWGFSLLEIGFPGEKYVLVSLEAFQQVHPRAHLQFGVLEVMAQSVEASWYSNIGVEGEEPVLERRQVRGCRELEHDLPLGALWLGPRLTQRLRVPRSCALHAVWPFPFSTQQVVCHPNILQNGKASVIHTAVESSCPPLSTEGVIELLRHKRFVIVNDVPDNHPANFRRQQQVVQGCWFPPGNQICYHAPISRISSIS